MVETAKIFIEKGTELVALSLGSEGALFIQADKVIKAKGLNVDVKGTVGAGDAMLGAICYGVHKDLPLKKWYVWLLEHLQPRSVWKALSLHHLVMYMSFPEKFSLKKFRRTI